MKLALLNTTIVTTDGLYEVRTIKLEEAQNLAQSNELDSAVGHDTTAQIMSDLLGVEVETCRQQFSQEIGQMALVFKLKGRPPEGVILSRQEIEAMGYEFKLMVRKE